MNRFGWPESIAICVTALSTAAVLMPWSTMEKHFWDALSAIGTLAAVVVAIAVPLWQNFDRLREQRRERLMVDWVLAKETFRLCKSIEAAAQLLLDDSGDPSITSLRYVVSQLDAAKARTHDGFGSHVLSECLAMAATIHAVLEDRAPRRGGGDARSFLNNPRSFPMTTELREELQRSMQLASLAARWMDEILRQCRHLSVQVPGLVEGAGEASITVEAHGQ